MIREESVRRAQVRDTNLANTSLFENDKRNEPVSLLAIAIGGKREAVQAGRIPGCSLLMSLLTTSRSTERAAIAGSDKGR